MKILFKFPSRGRPEKFKETLTEHLKMLSNKNDYKFIFTFDTDDETMNNPQIREYLESLKINCKINYGNSTNKIQAINANMDDDDFDILILIADDMIPILPNYDELICDLFNNSEHKLDSTIHFATAMWAHLLDVWCIMGKKYYDRFGYIYHPDYKSISADNEYTEVSIMLGRTILCHSTPFIHNFLTGDSTAVRNHQYNTDDYWAYVKRKEINFGL
jgi:hypothetical protein